MSEIAKGYLVEGESIHWQGRPATIVIVGRGVLLTVLSTLFMISLRLMDGPWAYAVALVACALIIVTDRRYGLVIGLAGAIISVIFYLDSSGPAVWLLVVPLAFSLTYLLVNIIYLGRVLFVITDQRIITRYGIFSLRYAELDIDRIQNVTVIQPWYERLLGYGDVFFATAGEKGGIDYQSPGIKLMTGGAVTWEDVRKPFDVVRKVNEIIHSVDQIQRERGTVPPSSVTNVEERLRQLSDLSVKGLISQEEYQRKRDDILRKL